MPAPETPATELEDAVAAFFRAARRARGRANQRTHSGGMSLAQFQLVEPLLDDPQTVGALAAAAAVAPATASRAVDGLVAQGFVERRPQAEDRRTVLVALTEPGRAAAAEKRAVVEDARRQIAAAFAPDERPLVAELLLRLARVVEEL